MKEREGEGRSRWKKGRKGEGGRGRERNPSCPVAEGSGVQVLSQLVMFRASMVYMRAFLKT